MGIDEYYFEGDIYFKPIWCFFLTKKLNVLSF